MTLNIPFLGLNSQLVKENGKMVEKKYQVGGMYSEAITQIVFWLNKALTAVENDPTKSLYRETNILLSNGRSSKKPGMIITYYGLKI